MQLLRRLSFTMLLMSMMTLVACGGGDLTGDAAVDDTGGGDITGVVTLTITKSDGDLSAANNITVTATVLSDDAPVADQLVYFDVNDSTVATFSPEIGTAVTDANGNASITVKVTDVAGGVEVTAGFDLQSASIGFTSLGDGQGAPVEGAPEAATISIYASSQQLPSSGAQKVELMAIAKDSDNNLVEGITINFSADSGTLLKFTDDEGNSSNVTGPDGKVSMWLSTENEPGNRVITATVASGIITESIDVEVVGTTLSLTGSSSLALNDEANYVIKVLDSDGNGIAKTAVALSLGGAGANITIPDTVTTDTEGQATIQVTGTSGGNNSLVVSALGASASKAVSVQSDSFLFTSFSNGVVTENPTTTPVVSDVSLTQTASVTLTWQRNGVVVADGTPITFTTTRGVLTTTDATTVNGEVTATLTSSDAGKALVTFVGSDTVDGEAIELTNQLEFEFFAETAATIEAQASPNSLGPNQQTSTISVEVKDANGNRVKNKKIKFVLEDVSGGTINPATAVTDSNGSASTVYTSNSTSAKDAVKITATVDDSPTITADVFLTVSERALFISVGTGNELEQVGTTKYVKEYLIQVSDAESKAVEGAELTISALPYKYRKGYWFPIYDGDEFIVWAARGADGLEVSVGDTPVETTLNLPTKECENEDVNFDGILDLGEDFNNDGSLTPGNKVTVAGSVVTDQDGGAVIRISYAQSYGEWLDIKLIASARVTGTESSAQTIFTLPVAAPDVNNEDTPPPTAGIGLRGPFGLLNECDKNISQDPNLDGS